MESRNCGLCVVHIERDGAMLFVSSSIRNVARLDLRFDFKVQDCMKCVIISNISNTKDFVSPQLETLRGEFKIRRVAEYF